MRLLLSVISASITLSLFGCSTSSPAASSSTNVVNGSVGPLGVNAKSAIANYGIIVSTTVAPEDGGNAQTIDTNGLTIDIFDKVDTCTELHTASTHGMDIEIASQPVTTGTYRVVSPDILGSSESEASADIFGSTATCGDNGESETATSGSVTVTSIDGGLVQGSFNLTFAGGPLTGYFSAPICPASSAPTGTTPACIP